MYNSTPSIELYNQVVRTITNSDGEKNTRFLIRKICIRKKINFLTYFKFHQRVVENNEIEFKKVTFKKKEINKSTVKFSNLICDEIAFQLQNNNRGVEKILRRYLKGEGWISVSDSKIPIDYVSQFFSNLIIDPIDFRRVILHLGVPGQELIERLAILFYRAVEKLGDEFQKGKKSDALLLFCCIIHFGEISDGSFFIYFILKSFLSCLDVEKIELWFLENVNSLFPKNLETLEEKQLWKERYATIESMLLNLVYPNSNGTFIEQFDAEAPLRDLVYMALEYCDNMGKLLNPLIDKFYKQFYKNATPQVKLDITSKVNSFPIEESLKEYCQETGYKSPFRKLLLIAALNQLKIISNIDYNSCMKKLYPELTDIEINNVKNYVQLRMM